MKERAKLEQEYNELKRHQEREIARQLEVISQMKREAARHEQIAKSESDLRALRESFVAKQDDLLRHKKAIESEYQKLQSEKQKFEEVRRAEHERLIAAKEYLQEEKLKLDKMR